MNSKVHPGENETTWETSMSEARNHFLKAMDAMEGMPEDIRVRAMTMMLDASPELEDIAVRRKEKQGGGEAGEESSVGARGFGTSRIRSNARDLRAPLRVLSFQRTLRPGVLYPIIVTPMSHPTETAGSKSKVAVAYANLLC